MSVRCLILLGVSLGALQAHAQPRELLQDVAQDKARQLVAYNHVFLQGELYSAARYRIVSVNAPLLLGDEAITITFFPKMTPLVVTPERVQRTGTYVNWLGRIHDPNADSLGIPFYTSITMLWWDLNDSGNAEFSGSNQFKFSPAWQIDENNQPVLVTDGVTNEAIEVGPPPTTPDEIAEQKRLLKLHRRAFGSFSARLELPTGIYVVTPLEFTPKYSVVYELNKDKVVPVPFEEEDLATQTAEDREKVERYEKFRKSLPIENKEIRGDLR